MFHKLFLWGPYSLLLSLKNLAATTNKNANAVKAVAAALANKLIAAAKLKPKIRAAVQQRM